MKYHLACKGKSCVLNLNPRHKNRSHFGVTQRRNEFKSRFSLKFLLHWWKMTAEKFWADLYDPAASDIKMCRVEKDRNGDAELTSALALNLHGDSWVTEIIGTKSCYFRSSSPLDMERLTNVTHWTLEAVVKRRQSGWRTWKQQVQRRLNGALRILPVCRPVE